MIDLQATYAAGLTKLHERGARGDEHLLHIGGDLAGMCYRETWARRKYHSGKLVWDMLTNTWVNPHEALRPAPPDEQSITSMQLGHKAEDLIISAIKFGLKPTDFTLMENVGCALIATEDGLQGALFPYDGDLLIEFAEQHEGVAIGHIDAIIHDSDWTQALVFDAKSTVWSDKWGKSGREWSQKYPPKDSHILQVSAYALAVSLAYPDCKVSAALLELDLGGKATRESPVDWGAREMAVEQSLRDALGLTDPGSPEPPAKPREWTIKDKDGTSWACGAVVDGRVTKAFCGQVTCPSHVLNAGENRETY